jgi:hypothetical protein
MGCKYKEPSFKDAKAGAKNLAKPFVKLYDLSVEGEKNLTKFIKSKKK